MAWRDRINTDIRAVWQQASTWVLAAIIPFPDIYNVVAGWAGYADIPGPAKNALYGISLAGILAKHYRQNAPKDKP